MCCNSCLDVDIERQLAWPKNGLRQRFHQHQQIIVLGSPLVVRRTDVDYQCIIHEYSNANLSDFSTALLSLNKY